MSDWWDFDPYYQAEFERLWGDDDEEDNEDES